MQNYTAATYGDRIADIYDDWYSHLPDLDAAVEFLAGAAVAGPVLELGIGTGRVALPLAARGLEVHGIDASAAMTAKLRAKPGGERIRVVVDDFADVGIDGTYSLVYVVFNTFFALRSQDEQIRCFQAVARHLRDGGAFVIQAFVPDFTGYDRGQRVVARVVQTDALKLDATRHDPVEQRVASQHIMLSEDGLRLYPVELRYAWPSELDLMARLAGLRLRERWSGWRREPFTAESQQHVSVYERTGDC